MYKLKNLNAISYYEDDEGVHYYSQLTDIGNKDLTLKYKYASLKVGFKWIKMVQDISTMLKICNNFLEDRISSDVCNHVLPNYIQYSDLVKLNEDIDTSWINDMDINSLTEEDLDYYEWVCYLHYYCLKDKVEKVEKQPFYCKDGLTLGFPIYYSKNKKYRKAEIVFC